MLRRGLVALFMLGCASPNYGSGDLRCSTTGACPDGYFCAADRCWINGAAPDLAGFIGMPTGDLGVGPGGPSKCGASSALLCDGFEQGAISSQWTVSNSATLDTTRAFRGGASIHVHTDAAAAMSDPSAGILENRTFPINGTAWVRVWAYFQSPFPTSFNQVINFLDGATGGISYSIDTDEPVSNDYAGTCPSATPCFQQSAMQVPLDQWTCLRIAVGQSGASGDVHLYVGDTEAADAALMGVPTTQMVKLVIGSDFYGNPALGVSDVWFDEVIVDNKLISCAD